jgi:surface protein
MEFAGDNNLKKFINKYRNKDEYIDEKIIKDIIIQICKGLKVIHDNKMIHRDLTPDNIFINENNKIKIGDFGVSKILTNTKNYAKTQIGKFNYLAPEILKGLEYDNKVDIYSLGCIIYELFTLKEYNTENNQKKIRKINLDKYNIKFQSLIDKLLNKNYEERPNIEYIIECIIPKNEITLDITIDKQDLNKNIYFISEENNDLKQINDYDKKIETFINGESIGSKKYFEFKEAKKYSVKIKFNFIIEDCSYMFRDCKNIEKIDLHSFNTENINNMEGMFFNCENMKQFDSSFFDTKNVTNMGYLFKNCKNLKSLDLSSFSTKKVKNMNHMFENCENIEKIHLSSFNTINVIDMSFMFNNCQKMSFFWFI